MVRKVNNHQLVTTVLISGGVVGAVTIDDDASVVRVGSENYVGRQILIVYNNSSRTAYWGFDSNVTKDSGMILKGNDYLILQAIDEVDIYFVTASGKINLRVAEGL